MKRKTTILGMVIGLCFSASSAAAPKAQDLKKVIDSVSFKHAWKVEPFFDSYELVSPFSAPFPFSTKSEPEAQMIIGTPPEKVSPGTSMEKILKDQIRGIQKDLKIIEYLEKDYKPVNHMVSYIQKIGNSEVGFLQYRSLGEKESPGATPVSVKQALFVKGDQLYNIVLMILYPGHPEEVKADQMELVKALIQSKL